MFIVVSPAKKLNADSKTLSMGQEPFFKDDVGELLAVMRGKSPQDLEKLMGISSKLGKLNYDRYQDFELPFQEGNSSPAIYSFAGDTYVGLQASDFTPEDIQFADLHLGILSGLYGLLRPSDWMQAYRLEMGTKLENKRGKDLYQFWGKKIANRVNHFLRENSQESCLINLASTEYFKSIDLKQISARIITPVFKENRKGQYKIVSFSAKRARGMMARYIIKNRILDPEQLKTFAEDNYRFNAELSSENEWVFTR